MSQNDIINPGRPGGMTGGQAIDSFGLDQEPELPPSGLDSAGQTPGTQTQGTAPQGPQGGIVPFLEFHQQGGNTIQQTGQEYTPHQRYGIAQGMWEEPVFIHDPQGARPRQEQVTPGGPSTIRVLPPAGGFRADTIGDAMQLYYHADETERARLQRLLSDAYGLDVPQGGWGSAIDNDYNRMWESAVVASSRSGDALIPMLERMGQRAHELGQTSAAGQPDPVLRLTSPLDAEMTIDQIAEQTLGRRLTDDEDKIARSIIAHLHQTEESQQGQVRDVTTREGGGGTVVEPDSAQAVLQGEVEDRFSEEREGYAIATAFIDMMRMASQPGI